MAVHIQTGGSGEDAVIETTCEGRVLSKREMNGYDDSDFYALVWDDETSRPREIEYATTRGWTYNNSATIDADDETLDKYEVYLVGINISEALDLDRRRALALDRDKTVTLNRTVRSKKNGTFEKGETGRIFWLGQDRYAPRWNAAALRAGVEFADGRKHFFKEADLTALVDEATLKTEGDVRHYAEYRAKTTVEQIRKYRKLPKAVAA